MVCSRDPSLRLKDGSGDNAVGDATVSRSESGTLLRHARSSFLVYSRWFAICCSEGEQVNRSHVVLRLLVCFCLFLAGTASWTQVPENTYQDLHWRMIGPFRGGRTRAAAGVPGQPNVFYIGQVNGGVWKTDDYGRTWNPIFDHESTQSIGAIAVAPSDPNIIYVGSGEGLHRPDLSVGNGIYKSTDAGKTWTHLGLRDGQQIPALAVDPRDPNRVFAAVLGHPYGPSQERGIYRSTDGGQNWQKVISKDENTGGSDVEIDPSNPDVVYASMWEVREGPWEDGNEFNGAGGGLFKSTDGGSTWHPLTNGLPKDLSQIYVAIAPSDSRRLYATLATARENLASIAPTMPATPGSQITEDPRPSGRIGGGDLPIPKVDPKNPGLALCGQHGHHALSRRRQNLVGISRRARRRRLPESLDQSQQRQHYSDRQRSGRDHHRKPGRELEFVVQPAHGAVLSRDYDEHVSLSRVRGTAGKRFGLHLEPRQRWRDHLPRLASRGRDRVWLRRARSARS